MHGESISKLEYALAMCEDNPMSRATAGLTAAFRDIVAIAERAGVRIVVVGAFARNVYLRPRMTDDADFLVRDVEDLRKLLAAASERFAVPAVPELICMIRHKQTGAKVDLIVAEYPFEFEGIDQARASPVHRTTAWVIPPEHLTAMKVDAASDPNRMEDFGEAARLIKAGVADEARVSALVRRDLPAAVPTLEAILRAIERARTAPPRPARGRGPGRPGR